MELKIDGILVTALPGQTLQDLIKQIGLDKATLADRPIAAKIAGEIFNLNYIPVRVQSTDNDRTSIRKAMQASNGEVRLLRYSDPSGKDVYNRTVQFMIFLALHQLWPNMKAKMSCTVGQALYVQVEDPSFDANRLKAHIAHLVSKNIVFKRTRMATEQAIKRFAEKGQLDKAQLLQWRNADYLDLYVYEDFYDYYYGEIAPSSGYLMCWDILPLTDGFLFVYPDEGDNDKPAEFREMPNFLAVSKEGKRWGQLMECQTVADLNQMTLSGRIRELIRVNEALHEKNYAQLADRICRQGARIVMLAGPSSSGKTTSANRLATQLRVYGKKPILMSLDDYYLDRDLLTPGENGQIDYEHINTIDTSLFADNLRDLLAGDEIMLPTFNFLTGKREWKNHKLRLHAETVIIVEGLHALNPVLLPEDLEPGLIFRLYVSPLLPLNLDDHNRIPTSYLRLLRRTVRDYETRGSSVEKTMAMWDSVRRGEKKWIYPFQENADAIFNSSTLYELAVLKKHIYPLLTAVTPDMLCYEQVRSVVKVLNYVLEADVDDEIPPTSLVREFIGGNSFYK